jgi:Tol biopolymer transport system component
MGGLFLMDIETRQPRLLTQKEETITLDWTTFAFSSAANRLAYVSWHGGKPVVRVVDVRGESRKSLTDPLWVQTSLSWSPAGDAVAYISIPTDPNNYGRRAHVVNVSDETVRLMFPRMDEEQASVSWSPTGLVALVIDRGGVEAPDSAGYDLVIHDPGKLEEIVRVDAGSEPPQLTWSADSSRLAYLSDGNLHMLDITTGADREVLNMLNIYGFKWSPDGSRLLVNARIEGIFDILMMQSDGTQLRTITSREQQDIGGAWSPDGRLVAFSSFATGSDESSSEIHLLNLDTGVTTQLTDNDYADAPPRWVTWTETGDSASLQSISLVREE